MYVYSNGSGDTWGQTPNLPMALPLPPMIVQHLVGNNLEQVSTFTKLSKSSSGTCGLTEYKVHKGCSDPSINVM